MMKEEVAEWVPFESALALIELSAELGYTTWQTGCGARGRTILPSCGHCAAVQASSTSLSGPPPLTVQGYHPSTEKKVCRRAGVCHHDTARCISRVRLRSPTWSSSACLRFCASLVYADGFRNVVARTRFPRSSVRVDTRY